MKQTREEKYREKQRQQEFMRRQSADAEDKREMAENIKDLEEAFARKLRDMSLSRDMVMLIDGQPVPVRSVNFGNTSAPATPKSSGRLEQELSDVTIERDMARGRLKQLEDGIKQLQETAFQVAIVVAIKPDRVTIRFGGRMVEVAKPKDACKVGDWVRIVMPSNQIFDVVEVPCIGTVAKVESVEDGFCDIGFGGMRRRLIVGERCGILKAGDSVIVDDSGCIALGKATDVSDAHVFESSTDVSWEDIGGLEDAKEAIREAIEYPIRFAELYRSYGKGPSKGVLLYGPPGTGKTMLGKAAATGIQVAHGSNAPGGFIYVKGPEILDKFVGETERMIRELFAKARQYQKETGHQAVLFIDEADALLGKRGARLHSGIELTVVPAFLAEMDGLDDSGPFVMLSTNRSDSLDPAVVRDGRIDRRVFVGRPNKESTLAILRIHLRNHPLDDSPEQVHTAAIEAMFGEEAVVKELTVIENGSQRSIKLLLRDVMSGAIVAGVVNRATERALRRDRDAGKSTASGISSDDARAAVFAAARELEDTDLQSELMSLIARDVGAGAKVVAGASKPQEMN